MDRLATLYFFWPLMRLGRSGGHVPILMYHSIAREDESSVGKYFRIATSPALFARHMQLLSDAGYKAVSVTDAVKSAREPSDNAAKTVAITFDDGYRNFYTEAFPVLKRFGFTATMYVPTNFIGNTTQRFNGRDCLTWQEIREMHRHGIVFGSHTMSHPKLHGMAWSEITLELKGSRQVIEQELGATVESFAYPYAFPEADREFKRALRSILADTYANGVCTTIGRCVPGSDPYFLNRLPVNSADDERLFRAKLGGGYDWLAMPQYMAKLAKRRLNHSSITA